MELPGLFKPNGSYSRDSPESYKTIYNAQQSVNQPCSITICYMQYILFGFWASQARRRRFLANKLIWVDTSPSRKGMTHWFSTAMGPTLQRWGALGLVGLVGKVVDMLQVMVMVRDSLAGDIASVHHRLVLIFRWVIHRQQK